MEVTEFAVMWRDVRVGTFYEMRDKKVTLKIELLDEMLAIAKEDEIKIGHPLFKLVSRMNEENYIDDEGVRFFLSFRVMPKNRMNCDKTLRKLGLSEYDQYAIFKKNNGACTKDDLWVNFSGVRYEDFHPRALYTDGKEKRKLLRLM